MVKRTLLAMRLTDGHPKTDGERGPKAGGGHRHSTPMTVYLVGTMGDSTSLGVMHGVLGRQWENTSPSTSGGIRQAGEISAW